MSAIQMSTTKCPKCMKKFIKQHMLDKKKAIPVCYKCHCQAEALRGHHINTGFRRKRYDADLPVKRPPKE